MNMNSLLRSKVGFVVAAALSLATSVQSAYYLTTRSRPSAIMMLPRMTRPSLFSRDVAQVIREVDAMFDSMVTTNALEDMMLDPFTTQKSLMSRPSYFLPSIKDASPFAVNKQTYEIAQDDKQIQIKINMPGVEVSNIKLEVDKENRLLNISGKSQREDNGMSVFSSFAHSFSLDLGIDESNVSAQMNNDDVLLITAPKRNIPREIDRRIDIAGTGSKRGAGGEVDHTEEAHGSAPSILAEEKTKTDADDGVIDLDVE